MLLSDELPAWFPLLVGFSVLLMLVLVLAIIIVVLQYQKRLYRQQEQLREVRQGVQQQLLEAALQAQEKERRRIGRDLHDDIGATLSVVKLHLDKWQDGGGAAEQARELLNEAVQGVRQISRELLPVVLDKFGLTKALESLSRSVPASAQVEVCYSCSGPTRPLPAHVEVIVYRVVQELLNNTLKHAEAATVRLELTYEAEGLRVFYADDGKGFAYTPNQILLSTGKSGLGLFNLQSRVSLVHGTLYYLSAPGEGTQAVLFFPVPDPTPAPNLAIS